MSVIVVDKEAFEATNAALQAAKLEVEALTTDVNVLSAQARLTPREIKHQAYSKMLTAPKSGVQKQMANSLAQAYAKRNTENEANKHG